MKSMLTKVLQLHETRRVAALDSALSELIWTTDAAALPRIIRNPNVPLGTCYNLPGRLFSDGKHRIVAHTRQRIQLDLIEWQDA